MTLVYKVWSVTITVDCHWLKPVGTVHTHIQQCLQNTGHERSLPANTLAQSLGQVKLMKEFVWINY